MLISQTEIQHLSTKEPCLKKVGEERTYQWTIKKSGRSLMGGKFGDFKTFPHLIFTSSLLEEVHSLVLFHLFMSSPYIPC